MEHAIPNFSSPVLLFLFIVSPFLAALCVYQLRSLPLQSFIVSVTTTAMAIGVLLMSSRVPLGLSLLPVWGIDPHAAIRVADFILLGLIFYFGSRFRHPVIKILSVLQIVLLAFLNFFIKGKPPVDTLYGDNLSLMVIMVASIATALSTMRLSFIPSLRALEDNADLKQSSRHRFFALLLVCIGALNGTVLSNDMSFFYFFFELITLGSFLLMAQKGTPAAEKKAVRTLSLTSLAGLIFLISMA